MKRAILFLVLTAMCVLTIAQTPESFNYQVVVRDGVSNNPLVNQNVSFRMNILKGSSSGESQYSELHSANTGALGIVNLVIGNGTGQTGNITTIDWGADTYYLKVEIDKTGGSAYIEMGTIQLLSVPYALHARTVASYTETDPVFVAHPANGITSGNITNWNSTQWSEIISIPAGFSDGVDNDTWTTNTKITAGIVTAGGSNFNKLWKTDGSGNPDWGMLAESDIPDLDWSKITTGRPTTLSGYGITDGVNITDNQIIGGNKTFTGTTTVPTPVNATDVATKAYVDALLTQIQALQSQPGLVKDVDGNLYTTFKIGNQVWLGENLVTTSFNDGTAIPLVEDNPTWSSLSTPGYCWYNNDAATFKVTYGALYNWYTVNTGKLCPSGWHVPSDSEWTTLVTYLGGENVAGGKLKEAGTTHWGSPNPGATNETSFTALPGGLRFYDGTFYWDEGLWWAATEYDATDGWFRIMYYWDSKVNRSNYNKKVGLSVRCLRD